MPDSETRGVAERFAEIQSRIQQACDRSGRRVEDVLLIGASKRIDIEKIAQARDAGLTVCGENRVQEGIDKIPQLEGLRWHLIGPLQRNKARKAIDLFEMIHSLDSPRLADTLDRLGCERERAVDALIEVNLGGESSKAGIAPAELEDFATSVSGRDGLKIHGLMTIPPRREQAEQTRSDFREMSRLLTRLESLALPGVEARHLSMGMSHDFELAIEEGATMVRIGTALFGPRPPLT